MKERPILFSGPMVRAILGGRKTQTRRVVKPQPINLTGPDFDGPVDRSFACPYGQPGDRLWVRETHLSVSRDHAHDLLEGNKVGSQLVYKTSFHDDWIKYAKEKYGYKWKPSIHMPFEACRLFLQITNIRIERLQDIGDADAANEGCIYGRGASVDPAVGNNIFINLWQSVYGEESWNANPWVWVIEFKQITKEEALS